MRCRPRAPNRPSARARTLSLLVRGRGDSLRLGTYLLQLTLQALISCGICRLCICWLRSSFRPGTLAPLRSLAAAVFYDTGRVPPHSARLLCRRSCKPARNPRRDAQAHSPHIESLASSDWQTNQERSLLARHPHTRPPPPPPPRLTADRFGLGRVEAWLGLGHAGFGFKSSDKRDLLEYLIGSPQLGSATPAALSPRPATGAPCVPI